MKMKHRGWILNAVAPKGFPQNIISGDESGEIKVWDIRASAQPGHVLAPHRGDMSAFAVHDYSKHICT